MKLPEPIAILQIGEHENGGEIRVAELELSAYSLPAGTKLYAIPEGWTLAPLQPTPEMKEAALPAFEQRAYTTILNLPGLRVLDMKELETEYHVKAEPVAISRLCPACGEVHRVQRHDRRSMFVRDLPTHGKTMMIHLDVPRLICLACRKTWMAVIQEVDANYQMTERLVRWIGRQSLEYTFAEMAKQVGIDEKTVRTIFDSYVAGLICATFSAT